MTKRNNDIRDMVLEWMQKHGKGYRAASKHFDIKSDRVKYWQRVAKADGMEFAIKKKEQPPPVQPRIVTAAKEIEAKPKAKAPSKQDPSLAFAPGIDLGQLPKPAFYEQLVANLSADIETARSRGYGGVIAQLTRHLMVAREKLDEVREAHAGDDFEQMPEDEYRKRLSDAIAEWPEEHLELALEEVRRRHSVVITLEAANR